MTRVLGSGPIEFNDEHGRMQLLSLAALEADSHGQVVPRATWTIAGLSAADIAVAKALAKMLEADGAIAVASAPLTTPPAMLVSTAAVIPATTTVEVTISAATPAADGDVTKATFSMSVVETATWTGLKTADLVAALGPPDGGSLIHVVTATPPAPDTVPKADTDFVLVPTVEVKDDSDATIFTLGARTGDSERLVTVRATDVDATAHTFTLTARWTKTIATATTATAATDLGPLAYSVVVSPARPGGPFRTPANGVTTLVGDGKTPASAPLPADV
jgi:hypothetical protein